MEEQKEKNKDFIIRHWKVFREAVTILQKVSILFYFLFSPLHKLEDFLGIKRKHEYFSEINLKIKGGGIVNCGKNVSDAGIISSWHEPEIINFLSKIKEGDFLDIGAHMGKFTIQMGLLLKNKGKVLSFEAQPKIYKKLKKNVLQNKISKNTFILPYAASNYDGKIILHTNKSGTSGGHSIIKPPIKDSKKISISCRKIDSVIKKYNLKLVFCMKLDVEGAEDLVLKGALNTIKKFKPLIIFEAVSKKELKKIMYLLSKFNYKSKKIPSKRAVNYVAFVENSSNHKFLLKNNLLS